MALSVANLKLRIARQLSLLGFSASNSDSQTDILGDAVQRYVSKMDKPVISASLSVTASSAGPYSIPATIRKVQDIRDASGDSVVYDTDATVGKVTLASAPSASGTYTVYGTPKETRTNLSSIVAAVTEDHEALLMAYCVAFARLYVNADAREAMELADKMAFRERCSTNRALDVDLVRVKEKDVRGQVVDDASNAEGHHVDIDDDLESDL